MVEIEPLHWVECHYDLAFGKEKLVPEKASAS
jgi:hypothetical protein